MADAVKNDCPPKNAGGRVHGQAVRWLFSGGTLLALCWVMTRIGPWFDGAERRGGLTLYPALTLAYGGAGAVLLATVLGLRASGSSRWFIAWLVAMGLAMRAIFFLEPPRDETDFYRYIWDGALAAHGFNPYAIRPADVLASLDHASPFAPDLSALAAAARPALERVNHPGLTTIYPPVSQFAFAVAYRIAPFDVNGLRAVFLFFDLVVLALLLRLFACLRLPPPWIAMYWWNPIVIVEFYRSAHMDGIAVALALAAVATAVWRWNRICWLLLGLAVGAKIWPVVLAPILFRFSASSPRGRRTGLSLFAATTGLFLWPMLAAWEGPEKGGPSAYLLNWTNNAGLFFVLDAFASALSAKGLLGRIDPYLAARIASAALVALWVAFVARRPIRGDHDFLRGCLFTVGGLFLLSPTQFPWYYTWLLPFCALSPWTPLLLYTPLLPLYHLHFDVPWVVAVEHAPVWLLLAWMAIRGGGERPRPLVLFFPRPAVPPSDARISAVIPALNEESAIGEVLKEIPRWVRQVVVADNGSADRTAEVARSRGATVVREPRRGYGAACLAGIAALDRPDIVVFLDGDHSDHPEEMDRLVEPILRGEADLVIGSRVLGPVERGALTPQQRFGNGLACRLVQLLYGVRYTDIGPFRAIRSGALHGLAMDDRGYGWTVQMQVRAARSGLRVVEVPVSYRRRIGKSKISGTVRGVVGAGAKIIATIFREAWGRRASAGAGTEEGLVVFARFPEAGRAKTRLAPLLGSEGAARLHRQMTATALNIARRVNAVRAADIEVRSTGGSASAMAALFGTDLHCTDQGDGDLGDRLKRAADSWFERSNGRLVIIGTDCALLTGQRIEEAFDALEDHDLVLGPAADGGYYLIGMNRRIPDLFGGIPWGQDGVLDRTREVAARLGLRTRLLPLLSDVDIPSDLSAWGRARLAGADEEPRLSIIVPARNEESYLAATLASTLAAGGVEIIVVDGRSRDRTAEIARRFGAGVVSSDPSRGAQMNAGAARARGSVLLFLHADTLLPSDFVQQVYAVLRRPGTAAGAFHLGLDAPGLGLRAVEWGVRIRSRLLGRPYGDQAIFMSRETFIACGGFPDLPAMEDYAMLGRLRAQGRIRMAPSSVRTSARAWLKDGVLKRTAKNRWKALRYGLTGFAGSPD